MAVTPHNDTTHHSSPPSAAVMRRGAPQRLSKGDRIGLNYVIDELIGRGGMAEVYRALHEGLGTAVALKVLQESHERKQHIVRGLQREARLLASMPKHDHLVRVFDSAEDPARKLFFVVMELLDGKNLREYMDMRIARSSPFSIREAVTIAITIANTLYDLHAAKYYHRDLKPENVYVTHSGVPKILDFGIAKVMDVAGGMGSRTQTGMLLGTPAYMSPEQIRNSKDVDARSDLFAAGGLLYELLAGHQAFTAANEFAKLTAVLTMEPEPIERVDPELARVGPFLARALAKDRNLRFQSADEMAAALSAVLGAAGAAGHGPSAAPSRIPGTQPVVAVPMAPAAPIEVVSVVPDARASATPPEAPNRFVPSAAPPAHATTPPASGGNNTLASPRSMTVHEPAPVVVVESARGGRLVPAWVVAILVAAALFFGFILGFGAAQSR